MPRAVAVFLLMISTLSAEISRSDLTEFALREERPLALRRTHETSIDLRRPPLYLCME